MALFRPEIIDILIILIADDEFHIAGDGKLGGILEPNPARCYTEDGEYRVYDYPSVSQINYVAKNNKINIIFAVAKRDNSRVLPVYKKMLKVIENSNFGILDDTDANNVISLVVDNYKVILKILISYCQFCNQYNMTLKIFS